MFRVRKRWIRIGSVVSPFVLFAILFPATYFGAQAHIAHDSVEYCDSLREVAGTGGSSQKANCYYQVAVKEGDPQICLKISGGVENTNLQTPCLVNTFRKIDTDDLVIDSSYCRNNFSEKYFEECISALAIIRSDISVCACNLPPRTESADVVFCNNMFMKEYASDMEYVFECPEGSEAYVAPEEKELPKPVSLVERLVYDDNDFSSSEDRDIRSM
jgi:hypothetical protein